MNDMENEEKTIAEKHNSYSNFIRFLYILHILILLWLIDYWQDEYVISICFYNSAVDVVGVRDMYENKMEIAQETGGADILKLRGRSYII